MVDKNKTLEFLGIDEGRQTLFRADTANDKLQWILSLSEYPLARALQRLDKQRVLMGYEKGYCIVDIDKGSVIHNCSGWEEISSAYRDAIGRTLLTGLNLNGETGVCVLTLDKDDNVIHRAVRDGDYVRLMTPLDNEHYMLSTNDHISICNSNLETLTILRADGFLHAWQSRQMADGTIIVTAGYGAFAARFTREGVLLSVFGTKEDVPPNVKPNFYACFDITEEGNILIANWQGHGEDNGSKGRQLLLFSPEGKFLDSWSFEKEVSSFQGLLLLQD